jgi:hypothetical protein
MLGVLGLCKPTPSLALGQEEHGHVAAYLIFDNVCVDLCGVFALSSLKVT